MADDDLDDDLDLEEEFYDDEDEPLPVIPPSDGSPIVDVEGSGPAAPISRSPRREPPRGNTKRADARATRSTTIAEAQGRTRPEGDDWREQFAAGDRSKAIGALSSDKPTHNAGSGFGLAG